jgi:solute carrier family 35 protein C2
MAVAMAPILFIHGVLPFLTTSKLFGANSWHIWMPDSARLLGGAFLAFFLGLSEYLLVSKTSGLTFSLSGIIKELATMLFALKDGDQLVFINWVGFVICVIGIKVHAYFKWRENKALGLKGASPQQVAMEQSTALLDSDSDSDEIIYAS